MVKKKFLPGSGQQRVLLKQRIKRNSKDNSNIKSRQQEEMYS